MFDYTNLIVLGEIDQELAIEQANKLNIGLLEAEFCLSNSYEPNFLEMYPEAE